MAGRVIDELVTIIRYNTSNRELRRAEQQVNDFTRNTQKRFQSWGQTINKATRAATVVLGALGAGAFKVGAAEERSLLNLRTQLGLTADEVEELKAPLRDLSKETNRSLKEVNDAMFSVKSAGLETADALVVMDQSAKAAASGLGETKPIALLASGAVYSYGAAVLDGKRAVEILLATVKAGNLDAAQLATTFGRTFEFAAKLGVGVDEVGTAIAGYTRGGQNASQATDAVRMALTALLAPSTEAEKILNGVGLSVEDVHRHIREEGFIHTIRMLSDELEGDTTQLRRLFGDVNAVSFALSASGPKFHDYMDIQADIRASTDSVNEAFDIYANSSVAQADEATNNLKLALSSLYNNVLAPLLQLFGKLPSAIQTVVLGMGAMQIASTIGLGPSIGGLVTSLGRFIVALKTGKIWNSNFVLSLRLAAISVTGFDVRLWTSGTEALGRFKTAIRTNVIPALAKFAATIWTSTIGALRALGRRLAMASLAMLRFATRAIVAGISAVITFGAAIWASLIPPLIAATAAVVGFTLALLANPVVLIVAAIIGAFVALGYIVYRFRRQIVGALKTALAWVKGNWPLLVGILLGPFGIVGALIWKFRDQIVDALMGVWNFIKDKWREIAGLLLLPILGPFALIAMNAFGLRDKLMGVFSSIKDFFMGIWGTIVGIFRDHWAKILAVIFPAVGLPILIAQEWDQIVGIVGDIWNRVYDTVKGWIEAIISFIKEIPGKVKDAVKDIPNMVTDAVKDIPVVGQVLDVAGGVADKAKGFLGGIGKVFTGAEGGVVPGPLGRPVPAIIHGGEMVLSPGASNVLAQMLEGFRLGPAALPQAPHYYGQMYRSLVTNRTVNININGPITIQTQATDAKGIAQELREEIQDQIRNIAYDHDGPVER